MSIQYVEQRRSPRVQVNARGTITTISCGLRITQTIRCKVIDISQGGACIEATSPIDDTDFYLEIEDDPHTRATCAVVWRRENRMGVRFI